MQKCHNSRLFAVKALASGLAVVLMTLSVAPASAQFLPEPIKLTAAAPQAGGQFGTKLASGDVNGDGFADLVVGSTDQVLVYPGGPGFSATPPTVVPAPQAGTGFGPSFLATGNVNGDRFADILVGATGGTGALYVYIGGEPLATTPSHTLQAAMPEAGSQFGISAAVGDVNADTMPDLVVGANRKDVQVTVDNQMVTRNDAGQVFVFAGPNFTSTQTLQAATPTAEDHFGTSVAVADVNADQFNDVIVTSDRTDVTSGSTTEPNAGEAVVFFGATTAPAMGAQPMIDTTIDSTVRSVTIQRGAAFGRSIAAGDISGDGTADLVIGGPLFDASANLRDVGELTVVVGVTSLAASVTGSASIRGPIASFAYFGFSVALGDVNGDGLLDVAAGAPGAEVPGTLNAGRAFVLLSGSAIQGVLNANITLQAPDPQSNSGFGRAVTVGDLDGNGVADVSVGANGATIGGAANAGAVYVLFSSAPAPPIQ
jgi:hypothetical protein